MDTKVLFLGVLVLLIALMFGCVQNSFCGNNVCEFKENDSTSVNYCSNDCVAIETSALTVLSDAVNSASPSGQVNTGSFILEKGIAIGVEDLASETDLGEEAFIFTMGEFTLADGVQTDGTYLSYDGSSSELMMNSLVICKPNNIELKEDLNGLDSKYDVSLAYNGCSLVGICCAIIPSKLN